MPKTAKFNSSDLNDELLNTLRFVVNPYDTKNRVSETTNSVTYSNISNDKYRPSDVLSYVKEVTRNGTTLNYGEDYVINYRSPFGQSTQKPSVELVNTGSYNSNDTIEFTIGTVTENGNNWVYDDYPRRDLSRESYPRVGFRITSSASPHGSGGGQEISYSYDVLIEIFCIAETKQLTQTHADIISTYLKENTRNFYNINYLRPNEYNDPEPFDRSSSYDDWEMRLQFRAPDKKDVVTLA